MTNRQIWLERVKAQLHLCDAEIARIEAKAEVARVEASAALREYLAKLRVNRDEVSARLLELQTETGDAMSEVEHGFEAAWRELTEALKRARTKFAE